MMLAAEFLGVELKAHWIAARPVDGLGFGIGRAPQLTFGRT